jgi:hypothetical protein
MTLAINADVLVTAPATFRNVADVAHPAENLVGIAAAASQGAITARQLDSRPILRAGEVLETVPGLIVSQHSGEGKANQYYLRGFNLDHGTDFSTMVAGVPVNMPSGARAHGYSDSSFLIPELVSGVQFRTGPYFAGEGDSTDQVGERAIASGLIPRFGLIDSSDGGFSNRESIAAEIQRSMGQSSLRATGYLLHNSLNLFSNFTYFLDDPERGDQFQQSEERGATGGRVTYRRLGHVFEHHTEGAVGVQIRSDWLRPVGLHRTEGRARRSTTREDRVGQTMVGVYAQSEIEWTRVVRTTLGLRADVYQFSVSANDPANSGEGSTGLLSPKVGAVFGPWSGTELYANAGFGYHSNDLFDAEVADIDYFYASRLPGEPAEGVEVVHTHPAIPRTARVALEVSF